MVVRFSYWFLVGIVILFPTFPANAQYRFEIIAHRGASAYAPENTLAAFKKAIEIGATMLELDVHQTKDSQLVVIHDASANRTTNGKGKIKDLTLIEIKKLDAGSWFAKKFAGEKIPTLNEVFDNTSDSLILLIELKYGSDEYPDIEERLIKLIHERRAEHRVILKSFNEDVLTRLRSLAPHLPRLKIIVLQFFGIIIEHGLNVGTVLDDSVHYLQHHWFGLTKGFIEEAHHKGYKVFAWDVDDKERMQELIEKGIDGIETDHPDWVKECLR
jgi:glycerophosphoryl diester phosphodiesterase